MSYFLQHNIIEEGQNKNKVKSHIYERSNLRYSDIVSGKTGLTPCGFDPVLSFF